MLRASVAHADGSIDVRALTDDDVAADAALPLAAPLLAFADAAVRDLDALESAREHVRGVAGTAFVNDAAAVVANFEMMTRVADTTGAAVDVANQGRLAPMLDALGIDGYATARWG